MNKIHLAFAVLCISNVIVHATEKNANTENKTHTKLMVGSRPYPADQVELSFIRTLHGGVQYVLAKSTNNVELINLIQAHLSTSAEQFKRGDFSVAELMHGFIMPGLAQLKLAKPDDIKFEYRALENGGKIHYSSDYPQFVSALHEWLEARAREHSNTDIPDHKLQHLTNSD